MNQKKQITIILPDCVADMPIHIVRGNECSEIILDIRPMDEHLKPVEQDKVKYALIWKNHGYVKVALEEIEWLEADRGYTIIHLTKERNITVSFNMTQVAKSLPKNDFIQIHRSYIVNLYHVSGKIGNCLKVKDRLLSIGREYRSNVMAHFLVLGVRRKEASF